MVAAVTFDWDSCQRFADAPVKYEFAGYSLTSCYSCATCCVFDEIIATEPTVIVASSSCREVPAFRKAMNGCELTRGGAGASLHEVFPLSCLSPSSAFLPFE